MENNNSICKARKAKSNAFFAITGTPLVISTPSPQFPFLLSSGTRMT